MQSTLLKLSVLAALASTVVATPPACLLACVSQVEKASKCDGLQDFDCICSSEFSSVEACLKKICPDGDSSTAISAFESTCKGKTNKSSSASSSATSSSSASSAASSSAASSSAASSSAASSSEVSTSSAASTSASASSAPETSSSSSAPVPVPTSSLVTSSVETTPAPAPTLSEPAPTGVPTVTSHGAAGTNGAAFGAALAGLAGFALL